MQGLFVSFLTTDRPFSLASSELADVVLFAYVFSVVGRRSSVAALV